MEEIIMIIFDGVFGDNSQTKIIAMRVLLLNSYAISRCCCQIARSTMFKKMNLYENLNKRKFCFSNEMKDSDVI